MDSSVKVYAKVHSTVSNKPSTVISIHLRVNFTSVDITHSQYNNHRQAINELTEYYCATYRAPGDVVGHGADVCADAAGGVGQAGAVLDLHAG